MPRIGLRELIFSANTFAAAMLALLVSFWAGLDRPFWAMATVYITSQPLSGAVRSKAVFRLVGTVVGAGVAVVLVPNLANAPVLLSLALALWVAACQFVSLLDRTPRSYMFMLAGYTAALIGFPAVAQPDGIFQTAVVRAEEIGIGVLCAAFVHSIVFPRSVTALLGQRLATMLADAEAWIVDAISVDPPAGTGGERRRMAADLSELHALAIHLPFDTAAIRPTAVLLTALQDRMVLLLPLVSAVEDRRRSLSAMGPIEPAIATLLEAVRAWLPRRDPDEAARLVAEATMLASHPSDRSWRTLLGINLAERVAELVTAWREARLLADAVGAPGLRRSPVLRDLVGHVARRRLHRDYGLAALSTLATLVAILGCCAFWIATAWPEGAGAAAFAGVICCFFATMDDPVPAQRGFLVWTAASVPLAGIYLFAILPRIDGFAMLAIVLAPTMLALGALMALPHWYGRIVPVMLGFAGGLALTNEQTFNAVGFFNNSVAQLVGIGAAIVTTQVCRSIGASTAIRRLQVAGWRDLAAVAIGRPRGVAVWNSRMLDRVGLLAARIGELGRDRPDIAAQALRELRIGISIAQLGQAARPLRAAIADHFEAQADGAEGQPSPSLLDRIDEAIADGWQLADDPARRRTLAALTGLRRNFFPDAPQPVIEGVAA